MGSVFDLPFQHDDIDSKLVVGLERLSQALRVLLWDEAKKHQLSPIQLQILLYLQFQPNHHGVSALAAYFKLTKPTVSDAVKTLEAKGLLSRKADEKDARATVLSLTPKGRKLAKDLETWAEGIREELSSFDEKSKLAALSLISSLIERLHDKGVITIARMCQTCRFFESSDGKYTCRYLNKPLTVSQLRVDCPEHQKIDK